MQSNIKEIAKFVGELSLKGGFNISFMGLSLWSYDGRIYSVCGFQKKRGLGEKLTQESWNHRQSYST